MARTLDLFNTRFRGGQPLQTLFFLYRNEWKKILVAAVLHIIKFSPVWLMPILSAGVINIITTPESHDIRELGLYAAILVIVLVQNIPTNYLYARYISLATRNIEATLRAALARRLQYLSMDFYKNSSTGVLQTKLLRDVENIEQLTKYLSETVLQAFAVISVAVIATAIRVPWFLLFFLMTVPPAVLIGRFMRGQFETSNQAFRQQVEGLATQVIDTIQLIPVTRAHAMEEDEIARLQAKIASVRSAGITVDRMNGFYAAGSWVTFQFFNMLCLIVAAFLVFTHILPITVGDVVMLTGFFSNLTNAVTQLMNALPLISKGLDSITSIGEVLDMPDIELNKGKRRITDVQGHFQFETVSFDYPNSGVTSIIDISLETKPGETVAIVGPSGAGKSTLLNLIIGFVRPRAGRILLDGQDMNTLDLTTYRKFLSVVAQDVVLFRGTIRENICYAAPNVSEDDLQKAILDANLDEFLDQLPKGLNTFIGEGGAKLSGGQRQRLAIARALVRNPRVLILDEATSALDSQSELLIQEALNRLMAGRTTFVVAHRLSTIRNATRIIVLDHGRIAEMGSHTELIQNNATYASLHQATRYS